MRSYRDYTHEPTMRTVRLPVELWQAVKAMARRHKQPVRQMLEASVSRQLPVLLGRLDRLGFKLTRDANKLVRLPMAPGTADQLRQASQSTGLPAVRLFSLCLLHQVGPRRMLLRSRGGRLPDA